MTKMAEKLEKINLTNVQDLLIIFYSNEIIFIKLNK